MELTEPQKAELNRLTLPLVEWLNQNTHPHAKVIVETTGFELVEGVVGHHTTEFVKG